MYKNLIIGLTLIILWGSGHYIWKSGGGELIRNAYSTDVQSNLNPATVESVTGIYSCTKESGCDKKYTILLKEDQTLQLLMSLDDENEIVNTNNVEMDGGSDKNTVSPTEERSSIIVNEVIPTSPSLVTDAAVNNSVIEDTSTISTSSDTIPLVEAEVTPVLPTESEPKAEITSLENLSEVSSNLESGTWGLAHGNLLILTITEQGTTTLETPQKLIIGKIGASLLSKISYNKSQYKNMVKPVFVRQN